MEKRAAEIAGRNPDDGHGHPVQCQASAKETWILREAALPEILADQRDRLRTRGIVLGKKHSSECRVDPEHSKIVS